jgi:hypothetical protein
LPLPPPLPRDELHMRRIEMRGYRRHDGLYDIEARITDTKTSTLALSEKTVPAGAPWCQSIGCIREPVSRLIRTHLKNRSP